MATLYVANNGSSSASGGILTPTTFEHASTLSNPGDTILVRGGNYNRTSVFFPKAGTSSSWITYKNYPGETPNLIWTSSAVLGLPIIRFESTGTTASTLVPKYVEINGLSFDAMSVANAGIGATGCSHVRMIGNSTRNGSKAGLFGRYCDYIYIEGNKVFHNGYGTGFSSGISINLPRWTDTYSGFHSIIRNNIVSGSFDGSAQHTDGNGIILDLSTATSETDHIADSPPCLVVGNVCYSNGGRGIEVHIVSNAWIINNTCVYNGQQQNVSNGTAGNFTVDYSTAVYFINNISLAWGTQYNFFQGSLSPISGAFLVYQKNSYQGGGGNNFTLTNSFHVNPLFNNLTPLGTPGYGGNANALDPASLGTILQLQNTSTLIDAGIDPTTIVGINANILADLRTYVFSDNVGVVRPQNSVFDLGAYEHIVTTTAPTITSVTPTTGNQGQTLSIALVGTHFTNGCVVSFATGSGITVNSTTFTSATNIAANITISAATVAGSYAVTVTNPDLQQATLAGGFVVNSVSAPAPTVSSATPNTGVQGASLNVVIAGTNFVSGATASFGSGSGITVNSTTFNSSAQLTANVTISGSAAVGGKTLTVTNPDHQLGTKTNAFTVTQAPLPAPTVTSATPNSGVQGATLSVAIAGANFVTGATVSFTPATNITINSTTFNSSAQITVNITLGASAPTGGKTITVTNPDTQLGSRANAFTITGSTPPAPTVSTASPNSGAQGATLTSLVIAGTGFQSGAVLSFSGGGITVNSTVFNSAIKLTASITIASNAAQSARTVTVTNPDTQSGSASSAFTVTAFVANPPTITSITPISGTEGQTISSLVIVGTGFVSTPTVSFGTSSGITINSTTFNSATQLTLSITISSTTSAGGRTVTVTNPDAQSASMANGFTVLAPNPPAPTVTSASPSSGAQGATLTSLLINGTNFQSGATVGFSGTGITINSTAFVSATQLTLSISISGGATVSTRTVTVTNPDAQSGGAAVFGVTAFVANPPTVTGLSPSSGIRGQSGIGITVTGTGFSATPSVTFGAGSGITVNSIVLNSATSLSLSISIASTAAAGGRTVTVTNPDAQSGSLTNGFIVVVPAPPAPTLTSASPNNGLQGQTLDIVFVGTGFQSGLSVGFSGSGITLNSTTFTSATQATVNVTVGATATAGLRDVTLTNPDSQFVTAANFFTVTATGLPAPTVSSINPSTGIQGQTLGSVVIAGTNFVATPVVTFSGSGLSVTSTTFNSASQLVLTVVIASNADVGTHSLTVTNPDNQFFTLANAFTVTAPLPAPTVFSLAPITGIPGQTLASVTVLGANFVATPSVSVSGSGVAVNSVTFVSSVQLTVSLTISGGAATTARTITVTNPDNQSGTLAGGFTVVPPIPAPTVSSVSPAIGNQGATLPTVIVLGTNFVATPSVDFGSGITTNFVTFVSATEVACNITISSGAVVGVRTVTVTNPDLQAGGLASAFQVLAVASPPTVTSLDIGSGKQNQSLGGIVITGANFVATPPEVDFGAGITVNTITFNSSTQITVSITIGPNAVVGPRTVVVENPDGQLGTLAAGFSVTAAAPVVSSLFPTTGVQGTAVTNITILGAYFVTNVSVDFGAGITVTSVALNSSTQLTVNIQIDDLAATGSRTVTVTNQDTQNGALAAAFLVTSAAPTITSINVLSGSQGQAINSILVVGTHFDTSTVVDFGDGIIVTRRTFTSNLQISVDILINRDASLGPRTVTVTNADQQSDALPDAFTVTRPRLTASLMDDTTPLKFMVEIPATRVDIPANAILVRVYLEADTRGQALKVSLVYVDGTTQVLTELFSTIGRDKGEWSIGTAKRWLAVRVEHTGDGLTDLVEIFGIETDVYLPTVVASLIGKTQEVGQ